MLPDLLVVFPAWPGWPHTRLRLSSSSSSSSKPSSTVLTLHVDPKRATDYLSDNPVFCATLGQGWEGWSDRVALKFALRGDGQRSLETEAGVYASVLERVQGHVVPVCHGLYRAEDVSCLVLDWWGECVDRPFAQLDLQLQLLILTRLHALHRQGILHDDFAERNVLVLNNDVRIIDFDLVQRHECSCTLDFQHLNGHAQVECEQLWQVCILMGMVS